MEITNLLEFTHRDQLRQWFEQYAATDKECWIAMYRSKRPLCSAACLPYIDVVEEALCFGWIDSTLKRLPDGRLAQRLSPRRKRSHWTELNKQRCADLEARGLMTDAGRQALSNSSLIMIYFDSDYMEGAHPEVMRRLVETNLEHTVGYGCDPYTQQAKEAIRAACAAPNALVQFLEGGTQTNATVIDALLRRHEGVLAAETAHINVHESGAIEHSGHKVLTLPTKDGKLTAEQVDTYITDFYRDETYEHMVAPGMLYITMPTEYGTLYSLSELEQLSEVCHKHHIPLYMDGARLGYALASPACDMTLPDIARLCDVFYIGGTKCGLLFGETVVAANPNTLPHFFPLVKQHGALCAKGRILGVQFLTLFTDNLYERICQHAVTLAQRLREGLVKKGYRVAIDSPTNQQFFVLPNEVVDDLRENGVSFEDWGIRGEKETTVRFVTSWATTEADVEMLVERLK